MNINAYVQRQGTRTKKLDLSVAERPEEQLRVTMRTVAGQARSGREDAAHMQVLTVDETTQYLAALAAAAAHDDDDHDEDSDADAEGSIANEPADESDEGEANSLEEVVADSLDESDPEHPDIAGVPTAMKALTVQSGDRGAAAMTKCKAKAVDEPITRGSPLEL
jgi:hypothetical protein